MSSENPSFIMPYSFLVGQQQAKLALEISYVAPGVRGVLVSGQRGTGKSTLVRAFARMAYGRLPVTLPISATDDRVLGGWKIDELMKGEPKEQPGLLEEANGSMLYVDEVNLLENHIVNIILDVASTGILVKQREGIRSEQMVTFSLVGTMNPEEGLLRPQLLDRFGLMVTQSGKVEPSERAEILRSVLAFDQARHNAELGTVAPDLQRASEADEQRRMLLDNARQRVRTVVISRHIGDLCSRLAESFQAQGFRGDYILALAAQAYAAIRGDQEVGTEHLEEVAPLALQHRRLGGMQHGQHTLWTETDDERMRELIRRG